MSKAEIQFNLRVPSELKEKIEISARDNNRSINAEAVSRLHVSFSTSKENLSKTIKDLEEILKQSSISPRKEAVAERLNECLTQTNNVIRFSKKIKPARIARDLGEEYAEPMENFFDGKDEPSFKQLEQLATYFNVDPDWLLFGDGNMYITEQISIPKDRQAGVDWLIDKDQDSNLTGIYFIRENNKEGSLTIVKQYKDWHCSVFTTPYHISEEIGSTGEANLIHLFNVWYWLYKNMPPKISINSYIMDSNDFIAISNGQTHPLSKINNRTYQPWWEDIWDVKFYKNKSYWDGWESLCERINGLRKNK